MDFVTVSTGLILPYWMGLPIRYIQYRNTVAHALDSSSAKQLSIKKLEMWIELYIGQLDRILRDAKVLLKK